MNDVPEILAVHYESFELEFLKAVFHRFIRSCQDFQSSQIHIICLYNRFEVKW